MGLTRIVLAALLVHIAAVVWAEECFESSIVSPNPFMGSHGEVFKLKDGSQWKVRFEDEYLYAYSPKVTICPGTGKMTVKGKTLKIEAIKPPPKSDLPNPFPLVPGSDR
ncbi:MAG: hypothetical protein C4576_21035 [Desulfobacteraceae bacterium]|nr:MAG: hypothetical protein C4576_21035 [Desulfobacteraceae bacterium]